MNSFLDRKKFLLNEFQEKFRGIDTFEYEKDIIYHFQIHYDNPELSDWDIYDLQETADYQDEIECESRSLWYAVKNIKSHLLIDIIRLVKFPRNKYIRNKYIII